MTARIVVPSLLEQRALRGTTDTPLFRCGMGRRNAERSARSATLSNADAVAVAGIAGGVDPSLRTGDVVVADRVVRADTGHTVVRLPAAAMLARHLSEHGLRASTGAVASAEHVVAGAERIALAEHGVRAVDMESAWLVPGDRPAAVVRVVADVAGDSLLSPLTVRRLHAALRTLAEVGPALDAWAAALGSRQLLLAQPRSFCAGVERAIEVVERALERRGAPVYVRKQIVHNQHVVTGLRARGAVFVDDLTEVPAGATVVLSAHGVSPAVRAQAAELGLDVIDATCPLVSKVHAEVRRFADRGDTVIFIGHAGHEETEGTMGERGERTVLVQDVEDARTVRVEDPEHVSYLVQTTLSVHEVAGVVAVLRSRFPALRGPASDDICYATTNRQLALTAVAAEADLVLVVGSPNSSNSRRLVETAHRLGTEAHLVDDVGEVDLGWLTGVRTVGLTAGASAPQVLVDEVVDALRGLGPIDVRTRRLADEDVKFTLPKEVRSA
jgi:4-hydroxy-3-methylbut-2-en-1-yl diphosphate reductase